MCFTDPVCFTGPACFTDQTCFIGLACNNYTRIATLAMALERGDIDQFDQILLTEIAKTHIFIYNNSKFKHCASNKHFKTSSLLNANAP